MVAVAAFLRVINALENIRASVELIEGALGERFAVFGSFHEQLRLAVFEMDDGLMVLEGANLHPQAIMHLRNAKRFAEKARDSSFRKTGFAKKSVRELKLAGRALEGLPMALLGCSNLHLDPPSQVHPSGSEYFDLRFQASLEIRKGTIRISFLTQGPVQPDHRVVRY